MSRYEAVDAEQFAAAEGTADWRVHGVWAHAVFRTGSFARGVELVAEIGRLADAADHHPDVLLRYPSVAVKVSTHDTGGLTTADLDLARAVSAAAAAHGAAADVEAATPW